MKIICDIPEHQVKKIRYLIEKGRFCNIDSFIQISVENQLNLESEELGNKTDLDYFIQETDHNYKQIKVSDFDDLKLITSKKLYTIEPPTFKKINVFNEGKEENLWIWGQINKVLPIKIVVRYLMNQMPKEEKYINLNTFTKDACKTARNFGLYLSSKDKQLKRERDERFSTAFPIGKDEEKAFSRFSSHFIGHIRADGLLTGSLVNLKFANIDRDYGNERIGITNLGLEFAKIENPLLDRKIHDKSLGDDEVNYYLRHIRKNVPGEANSFRLILSLIDGGVRSREGINIELKKNMKKDWSEKVINTQRAGVMSRLFELGLLSKKRKGVSVIYGITGLGKNFLYDKSI